MSFDLPPVTRYLLIANVLVFLLQQFFPAPLLIHFALWPWGASPYTNVGFQVWQLVTGTFMHGSIMHIVVNMFVLWMFGSPIERLLGQRAFLVLYFVSLLASSLCHELMVYFFHLGYYPTIGASGAIFGVLLAFGMLYPHERIMLIIPPIPMPAWVFVTGFAVLELVLGVMSTRGGMGHPIGAGGPVVNIAYFAHLGGMLGGFVLIQYWRGKLPIKPKRRLLR
ncbi:MAG TPA: rhomboid family intramembrane serine protease [Rhodanobacteraceae bacterium]